MAEAKPNRIKHDWYQTETHVTISILEKNVKKEDVYVECLGDKPRLQVTFKTADGKDETFALDLAHNLILESHRTVPSKIEVKLKKTDGVRWTTLERPAEAEEVVVPAGPPKFPTSCRKGMEKDWDSIAADLAKSESSENAEGEAALNALFQDIYMKGTDETKRAMNKSFQESGGTVLSTNWNEVEKDKITVKAPDGMEWKQWN